MPIKPFRILVVDHDRKIFSFTEPLSDDTAITKQVEAEQRKRLAAKRGIVNCQTVPERYKTAEAIIVEATRLHPGYTHSSVSVV